MRRNDVSKFVRKAARDVIIQEANKHKMRSRFHPYHTPVMYGPRHIQRAVFYVRQHLLVDANTLREAGFRPKALTPGKPTALKKLIGKA